MQPHPPALGLSPELLSTLLAVSSGDRAVGSGGGLVLEASVDGVWGLIGSLDGAGAGDTHARAALLEALMGPFTIRCRAPVATHLFVR